MNTDVLELCDQELGQYRILAELGRGGFGCVYKASHKLMDRIVALKVIAPERLEDERAREMFLREVRAATRLHHPNIALAYDAGEVDGRLFMAMEYVEGPTLDHLVRKQGPLPPNLAWPLLQQTAQALRCAHLQGMIHRDIKPANLLIPQAALDGTRSGPDMPALVKVVDFGLARVQSQGGSATLFAGRDRVFAGTPDFISPEQARSLHDVDIRSDLYSLGCTFYYAVAGRKPFLGSNALEIVLAHFEKEPDPLTSLCPDLPPVLITIIHRLMAKEPAERFQSADELLVAMGVSVSPSQPSWPQIVLPPSMASAAPIAPTLAAIRRKTPVDEILSPTLQLPIDAAAAATSCVAAPAEPGTATLLTPPEHNEAAPAGPSAPMHRPSHTLQQTWLQWQAVVAALAKGNKPEIDPADYRTLHAKLLHGLRDHAGPVPCDECRRLISLVEPWLNLPTLAETDGVMLRDLLTRSGSLAHAVGLADAAGALPWWLLPAVLALLMVPLAAIASMQLSAGRLAWQAPSLAAAWQFVNAHPTLTLTLLLPASVLAGLYGLGRLLRA